MASPNHIHSQTKLGIFPAFQEYSSGRISVRAEGYYKKRFLGQVWGSASALGFN